MIAVAVLAVAALVYKTGTRSSRHTQKLYTAIKTWLVDKFAGLVTWVKQRTIRSRQCLQGMYQAVIGDSNVPDMIQGIGDQFGRLDRAMVQPVERGDRPGQRASEADGGADAGQSDPE